MIPSLEVGKVPHTLLAGVVVTRDAGSAALPKQKDPQEGLFLLINWIVFHDFFSSKRLMG